MEKKVTKISYFTLSKCLLSFLVFVIGIIVINNTYSETTTSTMWDGVTVANSFTGGNGSEENPYQISSGAELAYFKSVIEGNDYQKYIDKKYILIDNIDLGANEFEPIGDELHSFSGVFDGDGYTISSLKQTNSKQINDNNYSGLFTFADGATIKNINFSSINIELENINNANIGMIISNGKNTTIDNVSIINANVNLNDNEQLVVGGLVGDAYNINLNNVYINFVNDGTKENYVGSLFGKINQAVFNNVVIYADVKNSLSDNLIFGQTVDEVNTDNIYTYQIESENMIFDKNITGDEILSNLNIDNDFEWYLEDNFFKLRTKQAEELSVQLFRLPTYTAKAITEHESGIFDDTVYVNDFEADYNYYMGLNYTTSSDNDTPTIDNKNLYGNNNLVRVQINYSGIETLDNGETLIGYVSKEERQNKYIYYKYFSVDDNGTSDLTDDFIKFELIDNPFTDRPTNKGFNNWITNYPGAYISLDVDYYVRYVTIPITYSDGLPNDICIDFGATWVDAKVGMKTSSNNWSSVFNELETFGMHQLEVVKTYYEPYDMSGYFRQVILKRGESYAGYYNNRGQLQNNGTCRRNTCTYYDLIDNENYTDGETYYELVNNRMSEVDPSTLPLVSVTETNEQYVNANMAGYYELVTLSNGQSYGAGYYNNNGVLQTSGTCSNTTCTYYRLIQYSDNDIFDENKTYYYLTTRDTNIVLLTGDITNSWSSNETKPLTFTSVYNDLDYRNTVTWDVSNTYVKCYNDTVIENMKINSGQTSAITSPTNSQTTARYLYGNWKNLKVGRGITRSGSNQNFKVVLGGDNASSGSTSNTDNYRLTLESGNYDTLSLTVGTLQSWFIFSYTNYVMSQGIYGNDYDRVNNNNDDLDIYYCASGSWGSDIYGNETAAIGLDLTVKSGTFGSSKNDNTSGIYVGGRQGGTHYTSRRVTYEGGYTYNLIGGPLTANNRSNINDTYMYIKGGSIDMITGGAGQTATYGNRILQLTGGIINYSVFAGSNGYDGSASDGTVNGDGYIYLGGNAVVGSEENVNNNASLFGAEAGSVFGIGNGRSGYTSIGSSDNANIVMDNQAYVRRNIYGGGNFGATGISSTESGTKTQIQIHGGTVDGSVYGGGNSNGSGSETINSTIEILVDGGNINGSVYGGSNQKGTIYGDVSLKIFGGTIGYDVYGGGYGGYQNTTDVGTYVTGNVLLNIGKTSNGKATINGSVYGGSAFGTVNGDQETTSSSGKTNVVVDDGIIANSVFGGGRGSTDYVPYVKGDITVTINGGFIGSVFGGNDANGIPDGSVYVYLNGGEVGDAFGGGNDSSVTITNIYLQGTKVTNLYGGSNSSGDVTKSNVFVKSGEVIDVYGGNNSGGTVTDSHVVVTGAKITGGVYGGGNQADITNTVVDINNTEVNIPEVFGGGRSSNATNTEINLNSGSISNVYGGSNEQGTVATSTINADGIEQKGSTGVSMDVSYNAYDVTWESSVYPTVVDITVTLKNLTDNAINSYEGIIKTDDGVIFNNYSNTDVTAVDGNLTFNQNNKYYGINGLSAQGEYSFTFSIFTNQNKDNFDLEYEFLGIDDSGINYGDSYPKPLFVENLYGGNNQGGITSLTTITINGGTFGNVYGGGNNAPVVSPTVNINGGEINNVYGGGNNAAVNASTQVTTTGGKILNNLYGGGNQGVVLNDSVVKISDTTVLGSIYAGGNGVTAIVEGDTSLKIGGQTVVGSETSVAPSQGSVFGGGNAAPTGTLTNNNSKAVVNIAGARIYGNIYGGANTSVVYGKTYINLGYNTTDMTDLAKADIYVKGTVFGGGEANASGSEDYDFDFISVTDGIVVNIDGGLYQNFDLYGSIFGSGNASSTSGDSEINITNYGSADDIKKNISIQRTNVLTIQNSYFELTGATDRTNEYSDYLYSLSRIDELKLANNSALYVKATANLLKKFTSLKITTDGEELATVDIDSDTKEVIKNVDNRLYTYEGVVLNVATNESATAYGKVEGMSFFGLYTYESGDYPSTGLYKSSYNYGDQASSNDLYLFIKGSYVMGLHKTNHDITKDGFYTNYDDEGQIKVDYIDPTPKDANFYRWIIGELVKEYEIKLIVSKYSTLGAVEQPLLDFAQGNTEFTILDFNYSDLKEGLSLVDPATIPRIAATGTEADSNMGLSMKTSNTGWSSVGRTDFMTDETNPIVGTTSYKSENSTIVPTLLFYLYHSKNIETEGDLGSVRITLMAVTKIDDLTSKPERLSIHIDISSDLRPANDYEGGITAGREYGMFAPSLTNITTKSAFSTYYSLYVESDTDLYKTGYHRSLVSSYIFPENTEITLIDLSSDTLNYYYYVVDQDDVNRATNEFNQHREASYNFSLFKKMGSTTEGNVFNDESMNEFYYDADKKIASEEFIVIVDFADTNITTDSLNNSLLIELRNQDEQTMISVYGYQQEQIVYNLYASEDAIVDIEGNLDSDTIYKEDIANLVLNTNFIQQTNISNTVYDTNYFDKKLGLKLTILDSDGQPLNGTSIFGLYYELDGKIYYPNMDGTTRIKIADKVSNVQSRIKIHTDKLNLESGSYTLEIESFASPDGIYYGLDASDTLLIPFNFINKVFGLKVTTDEKSVIIDKDTGYTGNGNNSLVYLINYFSGLDNPSIRVSLSRRKYEQVYSDEYELVDLTNYITNNYSLVENYEYLLSSSPVDRTTIFFNMKPNLPTGTYKILFKLYDGNKFIGEVEKYLIIE